MYHLYISDFARFQQLNTAELDTFTTLIFQWRSTTEMLTWLEAQNH